MIWKGENWFSFFCMYIKEAKENLYHFLTHLKKLVLK